MSVYREFMDKIEPQTTAEELAARAAGREHSEKKRRIRPLAALAAGIAAAAALTVTVGAFTGFLNFGSIMRKDFNDAVSSDKFISGVYQPLDVTAENDDISVTAAAFMGDSMYSYIVAEARLKYEPPKLTEKLRLSVKIYSEDAFDEIIENIAHSEYYGQPQPDENGETVYVFRIMCVPFWTEAAIKNNSRMVVDITDIAFTHTVGRTEAATVRRAGLKLLFSPDKSVIKDVEAVTLDREERLAGGDCVLKEFIPSEYVSRLTVDFSIDDIPGRARWGIASEKLRSLLGISPADRFVNGSCPIRLVADGEYIPYLDNDIWGGYLRFEADHIPVQMLGYGDENGIGASTAFCFYLNFMPFDYESAESVCLELQTADGTENVVIK